MSSARGICAAGHPLTAEAGARVLREGGNAVDAAIAAMLTSWVTEPMLTGPGAGGYLLVAGEGVTPRLVDFFVAAPGIGADPADRGDLLGVEVSYGATSQVFHAGAASCGVHGAPAGVAAVHERWGTVPPAELAAPAAALAREGCPLSAQQAYVAQIIEGILVSDETGREAFAPGGRVLREGEPFRSCDLGDTIERLATDGAGAFYEGEIGAATVDFLQRRGGAVTAADLAAYEAIEREPLRVAYRDREVLTNPPPAAGGTLLALALALLDRAGPRPELAAIVAAMQAAQAARTPEFVAGLDVPGFAERFLASQLGSTTHISVVDGDGLACSTTSSYGEGSGLVVPGTGIHLNNVMGEEDLSPLGPHTAPPGRRMPSMMAPTAVLRDGSLEMVLGSAGSNRIRSAILQVIVAVVDHGLTSQEAIDAPRAHLENGVVFAEPGVPTARLRDAGHEVVEFSARNLFFGGVQAVVCDLDSGALSGGGDPRRGGAVAVA